MGDMRRTLCTILLFIAFSAPSQAQTGVGSSACWYICKSSKDPKCLSECESWKAPPDAHKPPFFSPPPALTHEEKNDQTHVIHCARVSLFLCEILPQCMWHTDGACIPRGARRGRLTP